jgi:hypothetical protein
MDSRGIAASRCSAMLFPFNRVAVHHSQLSGALRADTFFGKIRAGVESVFRIKRYCY